MGKHGKQRPRPGAGRPGLPGRPEPGLGDNRSPKKRKRRTYSDEQRRDFVRAFNKSGQRPTTFCAEHDLTPSCLQRWRRELDASHDACGKRSKPRRKPQRVKRTFSPDERRQAVEAFKKSGLTRESFSKTWGVSANSLGTWLRRYEKEGPKGLETRTRKKPANSARSLPSAVKRAILETKHKHPDFGLRKVRDVLLRFCGIRVSAGSVRKTLNEQGIAPLPIPTKRPKRRPMPPRRFERARPGELWQSDITSFLLRRHSQRVYLTVFMDDHSRYITSFGLHLHQKQDIVIEALLEGIARFGKPREVLTDQGRQYFAWRGKSQFQKLLVREGIQHVVSRTHHPQTLGKCERFWATVAREFWERVEPQDLASAREQLSHFVSHYNHFRPHQGISGLVPADRFFSAGDALRKTLEEQMSESELDLALGKKPRKPVFLFGQIGSQQVSMHGEGGRLVFQTPEGGRQEMVVDELGIAEAIEEQSHANDAGCGERDAAATEAHAAGKEARELPRATEDADLGASAVATCERGGAEAGAQDLRDDPRILAGSCDQGGGDGAPKAASPSGLAALPTGAVGYAGRALEAAEKSGGAGHVEGQSRRPEGAEEEDREAGAQAPGGRGADRSSARVTREPGSGSGTEEAEAQSAGGKKEGAWRRRWNFARSWWHGSRTGLDTARSHGSPTSSE
jgi:transposase InsO family protein